MDCKDCVWLLHFFFADLTSVFLWLKLHIIIIIIIMQCKFFLSNGSFILIIYLVSLPYCALCNSECLFKYSTILSFIPEIKLTTSKRNHCKFDTFVDDHFLTINWLPGYQNARHIEKGHTNC